ncbi:hypothetical protein ACH5RR_003788 [Cinchona calisaya]|uniref:Uncharacterized protein n=1 Tax=Cinchona calisaya TaxID=153742 RepID=A0ABD3AVQ5_9GENT
MTALELKNFGPKYSSYNQSDSINKRSQGLTAFNFGGLFIIIASALMFALFCSETSVGRRLTDMVTQYSHRCFFFLSFRGNESRVKSLDHPDSSGDSSIEDEQDSNDSDQLNLDDSSRPGMANESDERNISNSARDGQENQMSEVQLSEQKNIDVAARQISS